VAQSPGGHGRCLLADTWIPAGRQRLRGLAAYDGHRGDLAPRSSCDGAAGGRWQLMASAVMTMLRNRPWLEDGDEH